MTRIEVKSRVGSDGVLTVTVPVGMADANREVLITVQPAGDSVNTALQAKQWERFIDQTAGCWQGEPLVRPEQPQFEKRQAWG